MSVATRKFNPGFLTEDELVASFCVRNHEFESIIETLRGCTGNSSQHQIVIGPRGSGKTTLLLRVAAEIGRDPELSERFFPIRFAEESYEVSTAGEFWLECLRQLAEQVASEEDGPDLHRTFEELRTIQEDRTLADRCLGTLLDFSDRQGKRLVPLVENLNMMFRDMVDPEAGWRLRHTLQTESRIALLASATSRFNEIDNPDSALYELLRVHALAPLDTDECTILWEAASGESAAREVVRPLEILTGGSPRLLAIVARLSAGKSLGDLLDHLLDLIDDHTDYFKGHIEALPAQERRVYLALAELWEPATTKEVAERARLDTNKCSAQLKRLSDRGAVRAVGGSSRRKQFYLTERLYNIYYLLRRHRGPNRVVRDLLRFMSSYYSGPEFITAMAGFIKDAISPGRELSALQAATLEQLSDVALADAEETSCTARTEQALLQIVTAAGQVAYYNRLNRLEEALGACDAMLAAFEQGGLPGEFWSAGTLGVKADLLRRLGRQEAAIAVCDEALGLPEPDEQELAAACDFFNVAIGDVLHIKGTLLREVGRTGAAADVYLEVERRFGQSESVSRREDATVALIRRARILGETGRDQEALNQCNEVLDRIDVVGQAAMAEWAAFALEIKGLALHHLNRPRESLTAFSEALERLDRSNLSRTHDFALIAVTARGALLKKLGKEDAARSSLGDALDRLKGERDDGASAWRARVQLQRGNLELDCREYESARRAASDVLAHDPDGDPQLGCRALLLRARSTLIEAPAAAMSDLAAALQLLPVMDPLHLGRSGVTFSTLPVETFDALAEAAAELGPARVLELLEGSPSTELLLPFHTALELELGRAPRVAREVEKVAEDVRLSLATARRRRSATDEENARPEREEPP